MLRSIRKRLRLASGLIALTAAPALAETAMMADSFVDSIGVNTHLGVQASPYYTNFPAVVSAIGSSGIRHLRDGFWFDWQAARGMSLINSVKSATGVNVRFLFTQGGSCNMDPTVDPPSLYVGWGYTSDNIDAFEGLNEVNGWCASSTNPTWYMNIRNSQQYLWNNVHAIPQYASIPVVGPSLRPFSQSRISSDAAVAGNLTAYMNYGNIHDYCGNTNPSCDFSWRPSSETAMNGQLPVWATETGFFNCPASQCGSSSTTPAQANKYFSRLFFEFFNHGIVRTYSYELMDDNSRTGHEATFGLLYSDGTPKPAFTTISNIISILNDPGTSFTPGALNYTLLGGPSTLHHTLLQKRNGTFYLALWLEQNSWDWFSPATVTVQFTNAQTHINQYDPLTSVSPTTAWNNVSQVALTVSDQATILAISPQTITVSGSLPDLIPTSLSYNSTTGLFTVVVKNQGAAATPSGVVIGNAFSVDGNKVTWGAVPGPLAPGASVTIDSSVGGAYAISSGTHTIGVFVDDVNRITESDKTNNQLSQTITV